MQVDPYAATNALARGFSQMEDMAMSRARRQAGNALSAGNEAAAMSALGAAGDLAGQQAIGAGVDRRAAANREAEEERQREIFQFLGQGAEAIARVPEPDREQAWMQLRPVLAQAGYPEDILVQIDRVPKTDQNLMSVRIAAGQEIERLPTYNTARGIVRESPSGTFENVFPIEPQAPNAPAGYRVTADGNLEFIPGGPADPRVISGAAGARRAPPRPRGSPSNGVNGSARPGSQGQAAPAAPRSGLPSGFTVRRR